MAVRLCNMSHPCMCCYGSFVYEVLYNEVSQSKVGSFLETELPLSLLWMLCFLLRDPSLPLYYMQTDYLP